MLQISHHGCVIAVVLNGLHYILQTEKPTRVCISADPALKADLPLISGSLGEKRSLRYDRHSIEKLVASKKNHEY